MSPSPQYSLPKDERLHGKKDIANLLANGKFRTCMNIRYCFVRDNGLPFSRIMVSVPKKLFKRAVKRNTLKRRIRESYTLQKHLLPEGCGTDIMFVYSSKEISESAAIFSAIGRILNDISNEIRKD